MAVFRTNEIKLFDNKINQLIRDPLGRTDAALCCILVHGTFAPDAEWAQPSSIIARDFLRLDPGGVAIYTFRWSGRNTHSDRVDAARYLAEQLALEVLAHPSARFLLVGHSHGGNIAMNAVASVPELQRAGVVCLGTPFLHVRARSTAMLKWIRGGFCAATMGTLWGGGLTLFRRFADWAESRWLGTAHNWFYGILPGSESVARAFGSVSGVLFAVFMLCGCIVFALVGNDVTPEGQIRALNSWRCLAPQNVRVLCVWFVPDEVYWALRLVRQTGEWVHWIVSIISSYIMPIGTIAASIAAGWLAWNHGMSARGAVSKIHAMDTAARIPLYVGFTMIAVPLALWGIALLHSRLPRIAIGSVRLVEHLWLDIRTERMPEIASKLVESREMPLHDGGFWENLMAALPFVSGPIIHSRVYTDCRTPRMIADWYRCPRETDSREHGIGDDALI